MLCDLLKFTVCVLFISNESSLALSQLVNFAISLVSFSSISLRSFSCINRVVSSANIIGYVISETALKSFMYNKNNNGPKIVLRLQHKNYLTKTRRYHIKKVSMYKCIYRGLLGHVNKNVNLHGCVYFIC